MTSDSSFWRGKAQIHRTKHYAMNYTELKRKTLSEAIKRHQRVIDDFRARISTVLNEEPVSDGEGSDRSRQARTAEALLTQVDPLGDQLEFANEEMKLLYDMMAHRDDVHEQVELGSIVATDKDTFFVSASIERFDVDGRNMFGLSTKTPLYLAMAGKREGDSFTYGNTTYTINEIF